jgi:hypothetical protein
MLPQNYKKSDIFSKNRFINRPAGDNVKEYLAPPTHSRTKKRSNKAPLHTPQHGY